MRRFVIIVFLSTILIRGFGQQDNLQIHANIKGMDQGLKVYLTNFQRLVIDSTTTVKNGFQLNSYVPKGGGGAFIIQIGKSLGLPNTQLILYLEKGALLISGDGSLFNNVTLSGSAFAKDQNDFRKEIEGNRRVTDATNHEIERIRKAGDSVRLVKALKELKKLDSVNRVLTVNWMVSHKSSPVSMFLLSTSYFLGGIDVQRFYFNQLLPAAKNNALASKISEQLFSDSLNGIGRMAPRYSAVDTEGHLFSLGSMKGKYILIDFWASWCHPCREEAPYLRKASEKYANSDFAIVSISLDEDKAAWKRAIAQDSMHWYNLIDPAHNRNNGVLHGFYVPSIPTNLLIDAKGKIIARNLRGANLEKTLSAIL